jgi:hypothetical protein
VLEAAVLLEVAVLIAALLYAIGAISQQTAPPATATYHTHGPAILNDLTVTPGAVGTTPQATLCSPSFHTGTVRNVPESLKQRVCRSYGIARADCTGQKVEIDHLISLELGGTNDEANLWPQPYFPKPAAKEKDIVENWLHRQVCTNAIPLAQAQHDIATDWYQVYLDLNARPATAPAPQQTVTIPAVNCPPSCGRILGWISIGDSSAPAGVDDGARANTTYYSGGISHVWSADGTTISPSPKRRHPAPFYGDIIHWRSPKAGAR